jgi:hypothetical protein
MTSLQRAKAKEPPPQQQQQRATQVIGESCGLPSLWTLENLTKLIKRLPLLQNTMIMPTRTCNGCCKTMLT